MEVITTVAELRARVGTARSEGKVVGLVPTMGAFHEGHLSLMRRSQRECGLTVVTLFVNPTQFGPSEDFTRYPRGLEADRRMAATTGAELLFAPAVSEVYPQGYATTVSVRGVTEGLCGASRPGHFDGVATVVTKLFSMAQPDRAYFGEKDYQQLQVIRRITWDLDLPVEIIPCPIYREPDGLAMSSRNRYLSVEERSDALGLSQGLAAASARFSAGVRESDALTAEVVNRLAGEPLVRIDYVELVNAEALTPVSRVETPALLAVAAYVGKTRLIDNVVLDPGAPAAEAVT